MTWWRLSVSLASSFRTNGSNEVSAEIGSADPYNDAEVAGVSGECITAPAGSPVAFIERPTTHLVLGGGRLITSSRE
jgi:hypothetical protein